VQSKKFEDSNKNTFPSTITSTNEQNTVILRTKMAQEFAIPIGSTVVITGANGYIASHVADLLLGLGYLVRGTVRSEKPWLDQLFEEKYGKGKFQSVVLPDLAAEGVYKDVIKGAAGFIHVVSAVLLSSFASYITGLTIFL
jgi:NADPH:quinone reductase-like Zn-dependent oxidoreductase